jgi:hypothetical protein
LLRMRTRAPMDRQVTVTVASFFDKGVWRINTPFGGIILGGHRMHKEILDFTLASALRAVPYRSVLRALYGRETK